MKLGIIGTGKIIKDALFALEPLTNVEKKAIFARPRSREKAEAMAEEYKIEQVFTDYDELLEKGDVDTVYIGLVNNVHYEYAKRALLAGKHVILEKPLTGTYEEAKELGDLAKEKDVFLFEAITVLHNPVYKEIVKNLPKLGQIRMVLSNYSQYSSRYDNYLAGTVEHSFDLDFLGGALRDINVYNLHYAVSLFGEPKNATYYPNIGYNGVDTSGTAVLEYDGFSAVCTGTKDSDSVCFVSIQGEKGWMRIDGKPNVAPNLTTAYLDPSKSATERDSAGATVRPTITEEFVPEPVHHRMTEEFTDFARMIDEHDVEGADHYMQESLGVMKLVDKLAKF